MIIKKLNFNHYKTIKKFLKIITQDYQEIEVGYHSTILQIKILVFTWMVCLRIIKLLDIIL